MSLATKEELETALAEWLVKETDGVFNGRTSDFIALCEANMSAHLRVPELERRGQAALQNEFETVPGDFVQARTCSIVHPSGMRSELVFKTPDQMVQWSQRHQTTASLPRNYSITGRELWFLPTPAPLSDGSPQTFELIYYSRVKPLTNASPVNDILTTYPDLYLYGSLVHAAKHIHDRAAAASFAELFMRGWQAANEEGQRARFANTPAISMAQ